MSQNLDQEQMAVFNHGIGAAIVIAGAGSGKTTTITHRQVRIFKEGAKPEEVLMLTFSRKAAEEMRHRMKKLLGEFPLDLKKAFIGTYHSFGYSLMREFWFKYGYKNVPTLMEDNESEAVIKPLIKEKVEYTETYKQDKEWKVWKTIKAGDVLEAYGLFRDDGHRLDDKHAIDAFKKSWTRNGRNNDLPTPIDFQVFNMLKQYETHKASTACVDYDDLICRTVDAMNADPAWSALLSSRYKWMTVDEAQDTSFSQYEMIRMLGKHGNVVMVGDDDQAIYSWRGARKENLERFVKDFGAKLFRLQTNYRSKNEIVNGAASHIAHNKDRFGNRPAPIRGSGSPILFMQHRNGYQAAERIAQISAGLIARGGKADDIAVLYRTNQMSKALQMAFMRFNVPVQVVGDIDLRKRKEVKILVACARLFLDNPFDLSAFRTVAEYLPGMGPAAVTKVENDMVNRNTTVMDAIGDLKGKALDSMKSLAAKVPTVKREGIAGLIPWVTGPSGLNAGQVWQDKEQDEFAKRMDTLEMVGSMIRRMTTGVDDPMGEFFRMFLDSSFQDEHEEGKVTLSTIHRAKGLEWKLVHYFGYSEGFTPFGLTKAMLDKGDAGETNIEEERRLSYVAMTRAKDQLCLHHAEEYVLFGNSTGKLEPSMFVNEIKGIVMKDGRFGE